MSELQLVIDESKDLYTVKLGAKTLFEIKKYDRLALKIAIVSMINSGMAKQVKLAKAFNLRRETIANYLNAYKKSGIAGLMDRRTKSHGIDETVEKRVVELMCESVKKVEIPSIISQEFGISIGQTKIYQIRKKYLSHIQEQFQLEKKSQGKKN